MSDQVFDSVGIIIKPAGDGKYNVYRIGIIGNEIVHTHVLDTGRTMSYATKEGHEGLDKLMTLVHRNEIMFTEKKELKLKLENPA